MITNAARWVGLDRPGVGHALRLAGAAWLAFAIASLLHVKNAYWAAMPIWVVAQSSRGLLFERAVSRVLGTLLGALCGFAVLALTVKPPLQLLALALTMAGFAGATHLVRGPHAYAALMAGITAAVVVVPSVIIREPTWALAVARVECTLIGVLTVTLVMGLFTPRANRTSFYQRARGLAGDAILFAAEELAGKSHDSAATEGRILHAFSLLDAESRPVSAGSFRGYRQLQHVDELVTASLAVMAAGQALGAVAQPDPLPAGKLASDLERLARDIQHGISGQAVGPLHKRHPDVAPRRLARLERALEQLLKAEHALTSEAPRHSDGPAVRRIALAPNRDRRLAMRTALTTGLAAFVSSTLAYLSGLPSADLAALGVCIFSMLLGSMAMPQTMAPQLFIGVVAGVVGATLYRLLVQPYADIDLTWLLLTLAPFLMVGGLVRASRRFAVPAVDANMCFMLASQAGMPAAGASQVLGGSAALVLGAAVVAAGYMTFPRTAERALRVTMRRLIRELERIQQGRRPVERADWQALSARLILRLMFHASHDPHRRTTPEGMLAVLNLGHSLVDLKTMAGQHSRAALATQALRELNGFTQTPAETADRLSALAAQANDRWLAVTLALTARSLRSAAGLIQYAGSHDHT